MVVTISQPPYLLRRRRVRGCQAMRGWMEEVQGTWAL
jgi:hypothetical protein